MNNMHVCRRVSVLALLLALWPGLAGRVLAQDTLDTSHGDALVASYFEDQVRRIEAGWLADVADLDDWSAKAPERRRELLGMLGLAPLPERTELKATITGTLDHPDFIVEKLHFQSMPGLYVTANLYIPRNVDRPLPAVLYLCGHANRVEDGVSFGSKTAYQHHPAWYARHGYVSIIIDTIQLAEIEGVHHGTHRMNRWWWWNRGYTPAGVEVWNAMRALDYLASRPEVDSERLAVTGRSGGGGYSWFVTAVDDRIKTTVPTAGITDLRNQVIDSIVRSHCDCMFMVNSERWDFPMLAALSAPRPVLLANGDHDPLFPLDGVMRTYHKARQIYALHNRLYDWQPLIVDAPHRDTPPLQQETYRWMHDRLKDQPLAVNDPVEQFFEPSELKVFDKLPEDQINTRIDELFVEVAPEPTVPSSPASWQSLQQEWLSSLGKRTFAGWPEQLDSLHVQSVYSGTHAGLQVSAFEFTSQGPVRLRFWVVQAGEPETVTLRALDDAGWQELISVLSAAAGRENAAEIAGPGAGATPWPDADPRALAALQTEVSAGNHAVVFFAPRGAGPTTWTETESGNAIRRSFMLIGQTHEGMQVWDVRRTVQAATAMWPGTPIRLKGAGTMAGVALYASLFEPSVSELHLRDLPSTHRGGPILLNVRRIFDMPQALALAMDGRRVVLTGADRQAFAWPQRLAEHAFMSGTTLRFE